MDFLGVDREVLLHTTKALWGHEDALKFPSVRRSIATLTPEHLVKK